MAFSLEPISPSLVRFLADRDGPEIPLQRQTSTPDPSRVTEAPATGLPRALAHESARGSAGATPCIQGATSDEGSASESSESILSEGGFSNSTGIDTQSIPSDFSHGRIGAGATNGGPSRFPCVIPGCLLLFEATSASRGDWNSHVLSHFGGAAPPARSLCIFCNTAFYNEDPWISWRLRMNHIGDHFESGLRVEDSRPDFVLIKHLWRTGNLSGTSYEHFIGYTERPRIEGLRPLDWTPEESLESQRRKCVSDWVPSDHQSEERYRKRQARKIKAPLKRRYLSGTRKSGVSTTRILPVLPSIEISNVRLGQPVSIKDQGQPTSEVASLNTARFHTAPTIPDRSLTERSLLANIYDSESEVSDFSQDSSISSNFRTSYDARGREYSKKCAQLDYDEDEDLISPAKYKLRLEETQINILKNSVAMLVESYPKSSILAPETQTMNVSVPFFNYTEMLARIEQNIRTLQAAGFCQGNLSFLLADATRSDVASLISVPISLFLGVGHRKIGIAEREESNAPWIDQSASFIPKLLEEKLLIHEKTRGCTSTKKVVIEESPSIDQSRVILPSDSRLAVSNYGLNVSRDSSSAVSSMNYSLQDYPDSAASSMSKSMPKGNRPGQEVLLRVPDLTPDPGLASDDLRHHGIIAINRGSVTVINHRKRNAGRHEPRSSDCSSADFPKAKSSAFTASDQIKETYSHFKVRSSGKSWNDLLEGCNDVLKCLQMKLGIEDPTHIIYTTLRVLDLIVLSYSRAHIGPSETGTAGSSSLKGFIKISGTRIYSSSSSYRPQKGAIILARRTLRCLNGFIGSKEVWVFHGERTDHRTKKPLLLSTSPEDFADIWGPMWKMTNPGDATRILRYDLEHGSIIPSSRSRETDGLGASLSIDEELCHWVSDTELRRTSHITDAAIISKPRLLIGAKKRIKLEENHDCHCEAACVTRELRDRCLLHHVGTSKPRRRVDAETVGGALGGGSTGLQVTYSMVTKIEPGRTFRESLIKRWSHDQHRRNPHVLLKRGAVEMSFCSNNSRRIRLIDLFGTKTVLKFVDALSPIEDQECNAAVKEILNTDPVKLIDLYIDNPTWREEIAGLVSSCLETLCDTGIKQDMTEPISLFWMYHHDEYIVRLPRSSHRWSGFVLDSLKTCGFLVLEEKCFVTEAGRSCQHVSKNGKGKVTEDDDPVLESALVVNERLDRPAGLKLVRKGKSKGLVCWDVSKLEKGSVFNMGNSGRLEVVKPLSRTKLLLKWLPQNPFKAGFHEFLSRIVETDPELHHTEFDGEAIEGDPLPISVLIAA